MSIGLAATYVLVLGYDGGAGAVVRAAGLLRRVLAPVSGRLARRLSREAVTDRVDRLAETLESVREEPRVLFRTLALAHLGWFCYVLALYCSLLAVGARVPFPALLFVVPVAGSVTVLSLPGGIGVVESATAGLLAVVSAHEVGALVAATVLFRVGTYWLAVAVGGVLAAHLSVSGALRIARPLSE
jgi:hypothetical protein